MKVLIRNCSRSLWSRITDGIIRLLHSTINLCQSFTHSTIYLRTQLTRRIILLTEHMFWNFCYTSDQNAINLSYLMNLCHNPTELARRISYIIQVLPTALSVVNLVSYFTQLHVAISQTWSWIISDLTWHRCSAIFYCLTSHGTQLDQTVFTFEFTEYYGWRNIAICG